MPRHLRGHEVRYWMRDLWICEGDLHKHLSRAKAEECERNPNATDNLGWSRSDKTALRRRTENRTNVEHTESEGS